MAPLYILSLVLLCAISCGKTDSETLVDCDPSAATTRKLTDRRATVNVGATMHGVYLVEDGVIDSKLIPCNLEHEYMEQGLKVIISGDVKPRNQLAGEPCCSENIIITKIRRE